MTDLDVTGVMGVDQAVPIYNPTERWAIWGRHQIWDGGPASGKFIPKLLDWVIDANAYVVWKVIGHDPINLVPIMEEIKPNGVSYVLSSMDRLIGGDVKSTDTYRIFLNDTVVPHTLDIDRRNRLNGSDVQYYRLYRGTDISETGTIISQRYDAMGNFVGDTIDMELVAFNSHDNYAVKVPRTCNTMTKMPDNEIVTAVFYKANGMIVSRQQLIVINTNVVRPAFAEEKYITHVSLESNFLSPAVDNILRFPVNVPLSGLNLYGRVHYSDGSTLDLPVDGDRFSILGLDQYVSTIVGQKKLDLVLVYRLSPGEASYNATINGNTITAAYSLLTVDADNSYTIKLFGYPEWIDEFQGYRMRWWMLNLDRNLMRDVTAHVRWAEQTGPFNPTGYGMIQRKVINLTLSDVSGAYLPFVHTQQVDIILKGPVDEYDTPWEISHEAVATNGLYGLDLRVSRNIDNQARFTIHSGITSMDTWISRVYLRTYPLVDPTRTVGPLTPTHFDVIYGTSTARYPIDHWNNELNVGVVMDLHKTVYIRFIRETAAGDQILSVAGMVVKN